MGAININIAINEKLLHRTDVPAIEAQVNNHTRIFLLGFSLDAEINTKVEPTQEFIFVQVNQQKCFFPAYLPQQVYHVVTNSHQESLWDNSVLIERLATTSPESRIIFFQILIHEIIQCQPEVLITKEIIYPVINQLVSFQQNKIEEEKLLALIQKLVTNFISVKSIETFNEEIIKTGNEDRQVDEIFEALFDKWNNRCIELHITEAYFKQITTASLEKGNIQSAIASKDEDLLMLLKERLFYVNGIIYPAIKIVFDTNLIADTFRISINNRVSLPVKGLSSDEVVVLHQPKNAEKPIYNIQNNTNYWLLDKTSFTKDDIAENIWPPFDYLVMMLNFPLRAKADWFVDNSFTHSVFDKLENVFPQLIAEAKSFNSHFTITQVLRLLAKEEISIRGMGNILQQILNIDAIDADESQDIIFDSRVCVAETKAATVMNDAALIYIYVRHHLKNYITSQCTHNTNNLSAVLFDPALEKKLLGQPVTILEKEKILSSLRKENLSPASVLSILTTSDVRPVISNLIKEEFPFIPVVAYRELTEFTNITVLSRINME